jgi:hypothetical protein
MTAAARTRLDFEGFGGYLSEAVNHSHTAALKDSVPPSRLAVSRTRTAPEPLAVSTQLAPPFEL